MIRQAHTYLAGAVSSTVLVAAAVVAFVLLVSFQALKEWPLSGLRIGGDDSAAVAPGTPVSGSASSPAKAVRAGPTAGPVVARAPARNGNGGSAAGRGNQVAVDASPTATTGSPTAQAPPSGPADGQGGSAPSGSSPTGSASSTPTAGGGSNPSGGGSTGSTEKSQTPSGAITDTVDKTVSGVDETTGGVLGSSGAGETTEKVVEGVAGPESTVGHTVDEALKTVGGLLGGGK